MSFREQQRLATGCSNTTETTSRRRVSCVDGGGGGGYPSVESLVTALRTVGSGPAGWLTVRRLAKSVTSPMHFVRLKQTILAPHSCRRWAVFSNGSVRS